MKAHIKGEGCIEISKTIEYTSKHFLVFTKHSLNTKPKSHSSYRVTDWVFCMEEGQIMGIYRIDSS